MDTKNSKINAVLRGNQVFHPLLLPTNAQIPIALIPISHNSNILLNLQYWLFDCNSFPIFRIALHNFAALHQSLRLY